MNQAINIPNQPGATASQLQVSLLRLVDQLGDGATAVLITGYSFLSGANLIRHNLRRAPRAAAVIPRTNVAWWQDTPPDETFVYITTAGVVTGDLTIWI